MAKSRTYGSEAKFRRATAYIHIHDIPHRSSKIIHERGGKVKVTPCVSCGREASHYHGRHGCCGSVMCHGSVGQMHTLQGEKRVPMSFNLMGKGILKTRTKSDPFTGVFD